MSSSKKAWATLAFVVAAFTWGLVRLYDLRLSGGDIYPPYSSFRADPLGAEALYESIKALPNYAVQRNFRPVEHWRSSGVTMLWLGEDPFAFALRPDSDLEQFEKLASQGVRLLIAFTPVKRVALNASMEVHGSALEKRWGVAFRYERRVASKPDESNGALPKQTALIMQLNGKPVATVDKPFGKGSVMLVANSYPFSNEALATERDSGLLVQALGPYRRIVFDETHLGYSEATSIAGLARRYRLWGLVGGLLGLAALFIWRNSSPLAPARAYHADEETRIAAERDSAAALRDLLRRNIPSSNVVSTCVTEWDRSGHGGRYLSEEKLAIIREMGAAARKRKPVEAYRTLQSVISQRE